MFLLKGGFEGGPSISQRGSGFLKATFLNGDNEDCGVLSISDNMRMSGTKFIIEGSKIESLVSQ